MQTEIYFLIGLFVGSQIGSALAPLIYDWWENRR